MYDIGELYKTYRPLLFAIAYRMLGTVMDAEDIVQDTFLSLTKAQKENIQNIKAFLCKITTNRCIDYLKSAKKEREVYVGPWLPEPLVFRDEDDPLEKAVGTELLSLAYLKVMESLSPLERAVFLLREVFDFDYREIAHMIEKTEANCRKIYSRSKQKISTAPLETELSYDMEKQRILDFIEAFRTANTDRLLQLVAEDAVLYSDGGGKVTAAVKPILSRDRVLTFLQGLYRKAPENLVPAIAKINGEAGIINYIGQTPQSVVGFAFQGGQIKEIYIIVNPDKLKHIR